MYKSEDLKVLLGNSIQEPEVDYDDMMSDSEYGLPVEEDALRQYYFVTITDYMNTSEFQSNYLTSLPHVRKMAIEDQQTLAYSILERLNEKYDYEMYLNETPYNQEQINEVYEFVAFIEYDHEKFITTVWKYLNPDTNKLNIEIFCESNSNKILKEIEEQLETKNYSELIANFLRTYNKEKLIKWFCEKSKNLYTSILITLREE